MKNVHVYALLIFVMLCWGLNVTMLKILTTHFEPLIMQGVRLFVAGVTIFLLLGARKQKCLVAHMPWKSLFIATFFGVICHHFFMAVGIAQTTATKATLICGMSPLVTALIAIVLRAATFTVSKTIGFIFGFIGIGIAVIDDFSTIGFLEIGDLFMFLSIFLQAFSFFAIKKGTEILSPLLMTAYMLIIGSAVLIVMGLIYDAGAYKQFGQVDLSIIGIFMTSAILATAIGHSLYNMAIQHIGAAESAIFTNFNTIFALMGASIFLGEKMHIQQYIGCFLIITAVIFGAGGLDEKIRQWGRKKRSTPREAG